MLLCVYDVKLMRWMYLIYRIISFCDKKTVIGSVSTTGIKIIEKHSRVNTRIYKIYETAHWKIKVYELELGIYLNEIAREIDRD